MVAQRPGFRRKPYPRRAVDIFKCFDQIRRDILYEMAAKMVMPVKVLEAYRKIQENRKTRNGLGTSLGDEYTRLRGIPQGCPFSMMLTAMLL